MVLFLQDQLKMLRDEKRESDEKAHVLEVQVHRL